MATATDVWQAQIDVDNADKVFLLALASGDAERIALAKVALAAAHEAWMQANLNQEA